MQCSTIEDDSNRIVTVQSNLQQNLALIRCSVPCSVYQDDSPHGISVGGGGRIISSSSVREQSQCQRNEIISERVLSKEFNFWDKEDYCGR